MVHILNVEENARLRNIPVMLDGGMEFILEYIKNNNIKSILEIGSAVGYSAIRFASVDEDIKVTTIERNVDLYKEALDNIREFGLGDRINIICGDALETVIEGKYDLNTNKQLVDGVVITTDGFGVFHNQEKLQLIRRMAETRGVVVLTDSDGAGFVIRNYLKGSLP